MTPRAIWLWFATALSVLLLALGWVTQRTLSMESDRQAAVRDAEVQEKVRLALWRMDAAASALLIREGARPPEQFRAFTAPGMVWSNTYKVLGKDQILVPSPLLTEQAEYVQLHFELVPNGSITSPQVPTGTECVVAEANFDTSKTRMATDRQKLEQLRVILAKAQSQGILLAPTPAPEVSQARDSVISNNQTPEIQGTQNSEPQQQVDKNRVEFSKRASTFNNGLQQNATPQMKQDSSAQTLQAAPALVNEAKGVAAVLSTVNVGPFQANWIGPELLLMREVREDGSLRHQGVWLDWPKLRANLLHEINDLFIEATLVASPVTTLDNPLQFASLPVRLVTGNIETTTLPLWTPFRRSLVVAWICALLAAAAVAALLRGTVALSERRASFVSAVTHELRTPLTTFRLYAELLANDMLPTAEKRAEYLGTLQAEAERLSHLVENVLAYAQLERGNATARAEKLSLRELIDRIRPALERRAAQVHATLVVDHGNSSDRCVEVDVGAVEQILFNLVDNACKYATPDATENIIHLEAGTARGMALLRVRDHGRGIHREETRRIFHPFHKSAQQAAHSAPGVGLGLALCRRLSHALGGKLHLDTTDKSGGACFVLEMPLA
ncbi:hypothetical protein BH11VER1_BH11VER1_05380 [soil metagenome]